MDNLYTPSKLLSLEKFEQISQAFAQAWAKDTAYPTALIEWSEENKALGQCTPTTAIIYDLFGGRLIYDKANFHMWNELPDGTQQDFSRCQFTDDRTFSIYKYQTKDEALFNEKALAAHTFAKYELLKKRFLAAYDSTTTVVPTLDQL
jgi:hypothetical protein